MLTIVTNKQQLYEGRLVHHKNSLQPIKGNNTYCNLTVSKECMLISITIFCRKFVEAKKVML